MLLSDTAPVAPHLRVQSGVVHCLPRVSVHALGLLLKLGLRILQRPLQICHRLRHRIVHLPVGLRQRRLLPLTEHVPQIAVHTADGTARRVSSGAAGSGTIPTGILLRSLIREGNTRLIEGVVPGAVRPAHVTVAHAKPLIEQVEFLIPLLVLLCQRVITCRHRLLVQLVVVDPLRLNGPGERVVLVTHKRLVRAGCALLPLPLYVAKVIEVNTEPRCHLVTFSPRYARRPGLTVGDRLPGRRSLVVLLILVYPTYA